MNFRFVCVALLSLLPVATAQGEQPAALAASTQLLVVTTPDWDTVAGTLQRYERAAPHKKWKKIGPPIPLVVAKKGLAWGTGVATQTDFAPRNPLDPIKQEGDTRAPAGLFRLGTAFGYSAQKPASWKMPYISLTSTIECVDDPHSAYYNRIVDRATVTPDWNSSEHMLYSNGQYRWGLVVDHNTDPVVPGAGSCIFMHIWLGTGEGTVGCTAMAQDNVEPVIGWLDPAQSPLLLQLPRKAYQRLRRDWKLPRLPHAVQN
jgi:L,D-peptidoglycan transpeptidase YkuD (ErfK/YbiS/YcfS/YnhG family)